MVPEGGEITIILVNRLAASAKNLNRLPECAHPKEYDIVEMKSIYENVTHSLRAKAKQETGALAP